MDQRKAFLFFGLMILVWTIFWHTSIRIAAVRYSARHNNESPAMSGLLVAV